MNKKSKKRAVFVYVVICLFYVIVTFRVTDKLSMARTSSQQLAPSRGTVLPLQNSSAIAQSHPPEGAPSCTPVSQDVAEEVEAETSQKPGIEVPALRLSPSLHALQPRIEPSLLISVPLVCHAIREGWLERDGLVFVRKDVNNNVSWRKPIEIIKDRDEEGLKSILNTIGKKRLLEFMKKEGISLKEGASADDLILGKGYVMEQSRLIDLYKKYVPPGFDEVFPFELKGIGIARGGDGSFHLTRGRESTRENTRLPEPEWMMPNLAGLPLRVALERLAAHTPRIKVLGNGRVVSQSPRPFERLKGDAECVIQGRNGSE
jgi:hypothetical protein